MIPKVQRISNLAHRRVFGSVAIDHEVSTDSVRCSAGCVWFHLEFATSLKADNKQAESSQRCEQQKQTSDGDCLNAHLIRYRRNVNVLAFVRFAKLVNPVLHV